MRRKITVLTVLLLACYGLGCASFSRNSLNALNASRDLYNYSSGVLESSRCKDGQTSPCIDNAKWDGTVQPAIKKAHDAIDNGYADLKAYQTDKSDPNKTALQAILNQIGPLIAQLKELAGIK